MASESMNVVPLFLAKHDIYNGMTIDTEDLSLSDNEFENCLIKSLSDWVTKGIRGVWFQVRISNSTYIPILVKHGFLFHHAKTSYVMLTKWLPKDEPNLLPHYPFTHIGVGGMVINDKNEVLTVQEKYHTKGHWKLPGGYGDPGEDFADTAKREVFEETGIETEFISVVAFRHHHQHIFDCSDIYVVCCLRPLTSEIKQNKDEIATCQWMDINTYINHPQVTDFNKFLMNSYLDCKSMKTAIKASSVLSFRKDCFHNVYHLQREPSNCDS